MKVLNREGKVVHVTKKAWEVIYKRKGFKKIDNHEKTVDLNTPKTDKEDHTNTITLDDNKDDTIADKLALKTNDELKSILDEHFIDYTTRMTKNDLISLIIENLEG